MSKDERFLSSTELVEVGRPESPTDQDLSPETAGEAIWFTSAGRYFEDLLNRLNLFKGPDESGSYIMICGFDVDPTCRLKSGEPNSALLKVLKALSDLKVGIHILLPAAPAKTSNHLKTYQVEKIPSYADVALATPGVHQQRSVVVYRKSDGSRVAYCGAFDLSSAYGTGDSSSGFPTPASPTSSHGVMLRVEGPAAHELDKNFRQRWTNVSDRQNDPTKKLPLPVLPAKPTTPSTTAIQVVRTLAYRPGGSAFFTFAAKGEFTAQKAWQKAISQASSYIYVEDTYFWSLGVARKLGEQLRKQADLRLVVVVSNKWDASDLAETTHLYRQKLAIEALQKEVKGVAEDRVAICRLEDAGQPIRCIGGLMIVDDVWAMAGSMTMKRSSMSLHSGLDAAFFDDAPSGKVKQLRTELWKAHLGTSIAVDDVRTAFGAWKDPVRAGAVRARKHDPSGAPSEDGPWYGVYDSRGATPVPGDLLPISYLFDDDKPIPDAEVDPLIRLNRSVGQKLLAALSAGRIKEMKPEDVKQVQELAVNGSFQFPVKYRDAGEAPFEIPTCLSATAALFFISLLDAGRTFNILSFMRKPGGHDGILKRTLNHGRMWRSNGLKDAKGRLVDGLCTAADISSFGGRDINDETVTADKLNETLDGITLLLRALPAGSYDIGLTSTFIDTAGGLDHLKTDPNIHGFSRNPQAEIRDALRNNTNQPKILSWYRDAHNHLHLTIFSAGEKAEDKKTDEVGGWRHTTAAVFKEKGWCWPHPDNQTIPYLARCKPWPNP